MTTKTLLSFLIPMLRSTRSTTFLKISSKVPLKKVRNLSLRLRWVLLHFWSWPVTRWHQGISGHIWNSSKQQQLDRELWGFLFIARRFWRKIRCFCLNKLQCFISSRHLEELMQHHLYYCTWEMMIQIICLEFKRKLFLFKLSSACQISYSF